MNLINVSAALLEEHFSKYFNSFMPLMTKILASVEGTTTQQKNLRARTIESIGILIASVSEQKEFTDSVKLVTKELFKLLDSQFEQDDPQELAIKDTIAKISFFLKEEFDENDDAKKYLKILIKDASLDVKITHKETREGELATKEDT